MLCYEGQQWNGPVATQFFHFSSTATSSAKREFLTIPERPGGIEELTSRKKDHTRNVPSFHLALLQNLFGEIICFFPLY